MGRPARVRLLLGAGLVALAASASAPLLLAQGGSAAPTVRIVANPDTKVTQIQREELARIYLGKKTLWDTGTRIVPAMPEEESPLGTEFLEQTLHKSVSQYRAYWKRLLFSGGGAPPRTFRTSAQVLEFVAKQPGAIGVVEASASDDRVKAVQITE